MISIAFADARTASSPILLAVDSISLARLSPSPFIAMYRTMGIKTVSTLRASFLSMVNPLRKSLVTGISKPNRLGLTAPMGIDPISMHRHRAIVANASLVVPNEARVNPQHMFIVRVGESLVGKIDSLVKERLRLLFCHWAIVGQGRGIGHSYFPGVLAMSTSSLFFPNGGYPNASELFGGLRK